MPAPHKTRPAESAGTLGGAATAIAALAGASTTLVAAIGTCAGLVPAVVTWLVAHGGLDGIARLLWKGGK